jgi:hypothetical protein
MHQMTEHRGNISRRTSRNIGLAIAASVILIPLAAIGIWSLFHADQMPRVKQAGYDEARKKWRAADIQNYDLELIFEGSDRPKNIYVEVRDGEVTKCLENGRAPGQQRFWDDWTINNQFKMIREDLAKAARPGGFAVKSNVTITLHGEFDPTYGFPTQYWRKARGATPLQCKWKVERFEPVVANGTETKEAGPK